MNKTVEQSINLLGTVVQDKVTGYRGTVTSVCFDLYGCIQAVVTPVVEKGNKLEDPRWLDVNRLTPYGNTQVMPVPPFAHDDKGPNEKPPMSSLPARG